MGVESRQQFNTESGETAKVAKTVESNRASLSSIIDKVNQIELSKASSKESLLARLIGGAVNNAESSIKDGSLSLDDTNRFLAFVTENPRLAMFKKNEGVKKIFDQRLEVLKGLLSEVQTERKLTEAEQRLLDGLNAPPEEIEEGDPSVIN